MCSRSFPFCGVSWGRYDLHVETVQIVKISVVLFAAMVVASGGVRAQSIYTCVDAKGNKRTADRPIAECSDREQRVLGKDGTVKRIVPPTQTPNERAAKEAADNHDGTSIGRNHSTIWSNSPRLLIQRDRGRPRSCLP